MARRPDTNQAAGGGGSDEALQRALRERSEQRITDLRAPEQRATGTTRIAELLAAARRDRDEPDEATEIDARDREPDGRLLSWVPPMGTGMIEPATPRADPPHG